MGKPFHEIRVGPVGLGQGRQLSGVIDYKYRIYKIGFDGQFKQLVEQPGHFQVRRSPGAMRYCATSIKGVSTIEERHVQMRVEVERRAKPLDQGDRAGMSPGGHGESSPVDQVCRDAALYHRQHLA